MRFGSFPSPEEDEPRRGIFNYLLTSDANASETFSILIFFWNFLCFFRIGAVVLNGTVIFENGGDRERVEKCIFFE